MLKLQFILNYVGFDKLKIIIMMVTGPKIQKRKKILSIFFVQFVQYFNKVDKFYCIFCLKRFLILRGGIFQIKETILENEWQKNLQNTIENPLPKAIGKLQTFSRWGILYIIQQNVNY